MSFSNSESDGDAAPTSDSEEVIDIGHDGTKHSGADSHVGGAAVNSGVGSTGGLLDDCGTEREISGTADTSSDRTAGAPLGRGDASQASGASADGSRPLSEKGRAVKEFVEKFGLVTGGSATKDLVWTKG